MQLQAGLPPSIGMAKDGRTSTTKIQHPKARLNATINLRLYITQQCYYILTFYTVDGVKLSNLQRKESSVRAGKNKTCKITPRRTFKANRGKYGSKSNTYGYVQHFVS